MTCQVLGKALACQPYHTGSEEQPGRSHILTGDAADPYSGLKKWVAQKLWESFDRLFDETAGVFDRYAAMCEPRAGKPNAGVSGGAVTDSGVMEASGRTIRFPPRFVESSHHRRIAHL